MLFLVNSGEKGRGRFEMAAIFKMQRTPDL
jgi:hypothetical protein